MPGTAFTGFKGEQLEYLRNMQMNPSITEQIDIIKEWW
jgi:hypothetical protein